MHTVRKFFITMVINIFLMLSFTVIYEYLNLSERFNLMESNIQTALDMSVQQTVAPEELFGQDSTAFNMYVTSDSKNSSSSGLLVFGKSNTGGKFYRVHPYAYAKKVMQTQNGIDYNNACNIPNGQVLGSDDIKKMTTTSAYQFLFGETGYAYNSAKLKWAARNGETAKDYALVSGATGDASLVAKEIRKPNDEFLDYYNNIGKYITRAYDLKSNKNNGKNEYDFKKELNVPVLANMGLNLSNYNSVDSNITNDNFISSFHVGKMKTSDTSGNTSLTYSVFFLTPASLGVTYVPEKVVKPLFVANLDTMVRLQKLAQGNEKNNDKQMEILNSATGCIPTSVYTYNGQNRETHKGNQDYIVNDGEIEYDLQSAKVKVEYFVVDYSKWNNNAKSQSIQEIMAKVNGCMDAYGGSDKSSYSGINAVLQDNAKRIMDMDSAILNATLNHEVIVYHPDGTKTSYVDYDYVPYKRIVARVSVRIKCHVCYQSSILQWCCQRFTGGHLNGKDEHYDIKLYNPNTESVEETDDGVWYEYSTYYCQSR